MWGWRPPGNLVRSLLAPGSTLSQEYPQIVVPPSYYMIPGASEPPTYFELSGTSMATPVVSGAAAIMIQNEPGLTPDTIKARLMKSARKNTFPVSSTADPTTGQVYIDYYDIFTVGAGYLNITAALTNQDWTVGAALSPSAYWNPAHLSGGPAEPECHAVVVHRSTRLLLRIGAEGGCMQQL
jgi:serine protease AprX